MSFEATTRNIRLDGAVLKAECRDLGSNWKSSSLNLDSHIGNNNGSFTVTGSSFSRSATHIKLTSGALLTASLRSVRGQTFTRSFDLNLCIANKNGVLTYEKPKESLLSCGSCYMLEGSVLHGLCMGYDGLAYHSSINLNDYYGNNNGDLESGGKRFSFSSRNVSVVPSSTSVLLKAECKGNHWYSGDFWQANEVDLATCILIRGGAFEFEKHDGPFDRDGWFAKFFERVPVAGFVVAALHANAGNEDHAQRAIAFCTNSTAVCAGIVIGALIGGPVGGAIGAGLATPIGILAETAIKDTIKDPQLRAQFEEATIGRYVYETLRNVVAPGAAGYLAKYLAQGASNVTSTQTLGGVAAKFGKTGAATLSEFAACWLLKKVADALHNGALPQEWVETEKVKSCESECDGGFAGAN